MVNYLKKPAAKQVAFACSLDGFEEKSEPISSIVT